MLSRNNISHQGTNKRHKDSGSKVTMMPQCVFNDIWKVENLNKLQSLKQQQYVST